MTAPQAIILVIDDSESKRYTIARYLNRAGYRILEAATGQEGLSVLNKQPEQVALVIVDVKLPDTIGYDICESIRDNPNTAHLPVMHISATYTTTEHKVRGLNRGADAYLAGPIDPEELVANVKALIRMRDAEVRAHEQSRQLEALAAREQEARRAAERIQEDLQRELTLRKKSEESLRESEERFRTLADNVAQLAWMADAEGAVFWYNKRWFDFTGTSLEDMRDWGWKQVHHPEHVDRVMEKFRRCIQSGEFWEDTFPLRGKNGQYRWFLSRAIPIRNAEGNIVRWFGTNTDITELRVVQSELERAQAALKQHAANLEDAVAERTARLRETIQELEAFSYSIAHDMRAPLRAMHGFAQLVIDEYAKELPEEGRRYLRHISASASRLDQLIRDVLNYSRIVREELKLERVNVDQLVCDILDTYPSLSEANSAIQVEGALPHVIGNVAALTQVFSNLLNNAVKFVAPGQTPSVRVWAQTKRGGNTARFWIEDNGIGIPPELQGRLFGIFQRLHGPEPYEGTGIGLAIVRKAVERMGGRVGLESEPGKGSRFWVEFKIAKASSEKPVAT
jgi:PAS domain S-box-containing protein